MDLGRVNPAREIVNDGNIAVYGLLGTKVPPRVRIREVIMHYRGEGHEPYRVHVEGIGDLYVGDRGWGVEGHF